ncbi:MAG TPA: DNA polymerase III subunit gamma/tau [Acidiferrobacterales bacterium]|nr:DNA polymerase III subunit gamma/tau [Acidiferrobacterales bacterium]
MSYQVLARKWRPRGFAELVGQGHVVRPLVNALDHNRLHHAFLFTGTRGVGKTTIARILAKSLNCETGVSAKPCGVCKTCVEIDEGRFIDLIEVDAASRTKVDDTRELLDNVQYAPTRGRYKVYLIDEVHMLSGHSFNALLKTLEEPPPHVKFLFATTDPQKLPVTILSRCLQFNLKRLTPDLIAGQLEKILTAEQVNFDSPSLKLLAQAADGSMRDALSLLDQAIAFGAGKVAEPEVREMLGSIDQDVIERLLQGLAKGDAPGLLAAVADVAEHSMDGESVLKELLLSLHRISLAQMAPQAIPETPESGVDRERLFAHAKVMAPEDVQLFYQIGLNGRRDLLLAPDVRTGLEMTLLRMLAFRPAGTEPQAYKLAQAPTPAKPSRVSAPPSPAIEKPTAEASTWSAIVAQLKLSGLARELANNTMLESDQAGEVGLILDQAVAHLNNKERSAALKQALEEYYGREIKLHIRVGSANGESPSKERQRILDERQQAAVEAITNDPNVRALQENFSARVNPASIRPKFE